MNKSLVVLTVLLLTVIICVANGQSACRITDEEEYAVFAAVLFPNEPDIPDRMKTDVERKAYLSSVTVRLDGFHGSYYTLQDETVGTSNSETMPTKPIDRDFNKKNQQPCSIEGARLLAHVPANGHVSLVNAEKIRQAFRGQLAGEKTGNVFTPGEIAYLSRPGFNDERTESIIEAGIKTGFEMGVAYRVYLKKSVKSGKWFITGATRTRIY